MPKSKDYTIAITQKDCLMSDSDSSISSNYVSSKSKLPFSTRKRPLTSLQSDDSSDSGSSDDAAFTFSKHRFSTSIHNSEHKHEAKSESDSEDSVLKNMRGYKTAARFSKKSHELYQDSDSDNDLEVQAVTNKTQVVNKENDNVTSRNNRTVMIDSDDSDNDLDKLKILESEAMKKARLAREALSAAPMGFIDIQDDEHTGDENYIDTNAATGLKMAEIQPLRHQMLPKGPIIKIKFRANIQSGPTNHVGRTMHSKSITLPFPSNTNVEQVMNSYREKVNATITSHANVVFMLDGLPMKMDKTLQDYDLEDEDLVDVLIDIPLTAQIQPPRHQMLPKGPIIKIKFRANIQSAPTNHVGRTMHSKSITLPFPSNTKVVQVMNSYREKVNATITPHAKVVFMLDGLPMKMDKTLQDYDLEDEDLVDVLINILP
jgi:hypothetical protein